MLLQRSKTTKFIFFQRTSKLLNAQLLWSIKWLQCCYCRRGGTNWIISPGKRQMLCMSKHPWRSNEGPYHCPGTRRFSPWSIYFQRKVCVPPRWQQSSISWFLEINNIRLEEPHSAYLRRQSIDDDWGLHRCH